MCAESSDGDDFVALLRPIAERSDVIRYNFYSKRIKRFSIQIAVDLG